MDELDRLQGSVKKVKRLTKKDREKLFDELLTEKDIDQVRVDNRGEPVKDTLDRFLGIETVSV